MLFEVSESVSGEKEIVQAKTAKEAAIKFLKASCSESESTEQCWDLSVKQLEVIK